MGHPVPEVAPGVFRIRDTCNVYVIRADAGRSDGSDGDAVQADTQADPRVDSCSGERTAIAIDFGSGVVLDHLAEMGVDRLTDVLMTHHHRDQGQGLPFAVAAGIRIHVPPVEQELFAQVDEMWRTRGVVNDDNLHLGVDGVLARVAPYLSRVPAAQTARFTVSLRNPTRLEQKATVRPVLPSRWRAQPDVVDAS